MFRASKAVLPRAARPEIPPSNEVYDFIIFRGQDIKDLTVLESGNPAMNDPAILSVNKPFRLF